jgi:hypothetical protein
MLTETLCILWDWTPSAINVMVSVAENEGKLDAINTWDTAFLTFGMFQWTAGQDGWKGELPALVKKVKEAAAADFIKYYGQHGLDIVDTDDTHGYFTLSITSEYGVALIL